MSCFKCVCWPHIWELLQGGELYHRQPPWHCLHCVQASQVLTQLCSDPADASQASDVSSLFLPQALCDLETHGKQWPACGLMPCWREELLLPQLPAAVVALGTWASKSEANWACLA